MRLTIKSSALVLFSMSLALPSCSAPAPGEPSVEADAGSEVPRIGDPCTAECEVGAECTVGACVGAECARSCRKQVESCAAESCAAEEICLARSNESGEYGVCAPRLGEGESCALALKACAAGLYCARRPADVVGTCTRYAGPGEACGGTNECVQGYFCGSKSVCEPLRGAGVSCFNSFECASGLYCAPETRKCAPVQAAGSACRPDGYRCEGSKCWYLSDACPAGQVCVPTKSAGCFGDSDCGDALSSSCCADASGVGQCRSKTVCLRPLGKCANK